MKTKRIINFTLALGATYLLHSETPGLNLFILALLAVISFGIVNRQKLSSPQWWFASFLLLLNGFSVFFVGKEYHTVLYLLALTYFVAVSHSNLKTFYFLIYDTLRNTVVNLTLSMSYSIDYLFGDKKDEDFKSSKWLKKSLIVIIPFFLFIIFLQLYRLSSENFNELSDFISFDWISPSWIALFAVFYSLFYTWLFFKPDEILARFEHKMSKKIVLGRADQITKFLSRELESKMAIAIVSTLSLLLIFLISSDFILFSKSAFQTNGLEFISKELHNGVYALIASIVITVALVSFLLRGNLNFFQPVLINITLIWLILNSIVVSTNFYKNWIYVDLGGLTYKRIGVFIYLTLTFIGLLYTIFKVTQKEQFFYIFRTTGISFFLIVSLAFSVNWDVVITNYNLSDKFEQDKIDYEYLLTLKEGNQHILMQKAKEDRIPFQYLYEVFKPIKKSEYEGASSWKSMVYSQYLKEQYMEKYLSVE